MNDNDIEKLMICAETLKDVWQRNKKECVNPSYRHLWVEDIQTAIFHCLQANYRAKTYDRHDPIEIAKQFIAKCKEVQDEKEVIENINARAEIELAGANSAYS